MSSPGGPPPIQPTPGPGLHAWLAQLVRADTVTDIVDMVTQLRRTVVHGVAGSSTTLLAGAVATQLQKPVLLVVAHLDDADEALEDLDLFPRAGLDLGTSRFGALEVLPGESGINLELLAERLSLVEQLRDGLVRGPQVIVAPVQALMQSVPEPDQLDEFQLTLRQGQVLTPARLIDWLERSGYSRTDAVEQPGDYATRGGLVDIYLPSGSVEFAATGSPTPPPVTGSVAVRVDYFGDEIDTINLIEADALGSGPPVQAVRLIGASAQRVQTEQNTANLIQLLPRETTIVLNELLELSEQARGYYERLTNARGIYSPQSVFKSLTERPHVQVHAYGADPAETPVELPLSPLPSFSHNAADAIRELTELASTREAGSDVDRQVVVLCQNTAEHERLLQLLAEHGSAPGDRLAVEVGYLHRGFTWTGQPPLVVIPHHELFHRYQTRRRISRISTGVSRASDTFLDLEVGDFVVHVDHGIALFRGMRTMRPKKGAGGSETPEDYLTLEFANHALLHVPAMQIDLVQKYVGSAQGRPPLSILGGKRWARQKSAVAEAVKDLAAQMLQIQAARASMPGTRYPGDTSWQREFEAEFPYDETEDQLAAIADVKRDMADEQPMDRLICGDVGFGKTEIAIRAAFKAVEFGKQVAVLVPTTVLAEQHERTFKQRMADFPFNIESISRFKTAGEQKKTIEKLARKELDIIIGTHRLLSQDVKFNDLGLVIIDEEQRFGVEHKQKLLQFRLTADVLTLSATPIPRTLHMAMLGLRDISSLSTPPMDRRAIVTEVIPFDTRRIKQALIRELNRDGQVFFVHNRVHNIQTVADEIQKLVPSARIIIGHGQMGGHDLEQVMLKFIRRQADILVCTTIIESGIDIPTANTIIINQADHFGLAELHQLRGRVGRYKHRAYCYLLLPNDRPITDTATRRLKAIEQYSMLGAGFKIAMRDLEIRGAGNLLGAEQSGHIAAVGYEMYCKLLEQAAARLRNEEKPEPARTHLELPAPTCGVRIPSKYISSDKHRMEAYKQLSRAATLDELQHVVKDITEAFEEPPPPVQALIALAELRIAASHWGIEGLKLEGPDIIFRTSQPTRLDPLLRGAPGRASIIDDKTVYYRPPANYLEPIETLLAVLRKLLVRPLLSQASQSPAA